MPLLVTPQENRKTKAAEQSTAALHRTQQEKQKNQSGRAKHCRTPKKGSSRTESPRSERAGNTASEGSVLRVRSVSCSGARRRGSRVGPGGGRRRGPYDVRRGPR